MVKGYWIPHIDVRDPQGYKAYMAATPEAHRKHDGRALVRGGRCEVVEGHGRSRNVLREFPDHAAALACYRSPEYQRAKPLRLMHATCDFVIAEGYDGVQPSPLPFPPPTRPGLARVASYDAQVGQARLASGEARVEAWAAGARKGYWIGHVDVTDPEGYKAYIAANGAAFGKFRGRFLVRGGTREVVEGSVRARTVVLEFPSYEVALACYRSPEYQAAAALRKGRAELDLIVVEGCDGPSA